MRDPHGEARRWFLQAEHDLEFARLALRERYYAQACFIAQQAAEKALKAILYDSGERVVLGHSIVELLARVKPAAGPTAGELAELAGTLDQYYVPTRYPNGLPGGVPYQAYAETQASAAVDGAVRFLDLARGILGA